MLRTVPLSETCRVSFQNKFEKLLHLVGFITRICHDARSHEHQICWVLFVLATELIVIYIIMTYTVPRSLVIYILMTYTVPRSLVIYIIMTYTVPRSLVIYIIMTYSVPCSLVIYIIMTYTVPCSYKSSFTGQFCLQSYALWTACNACGACMRVKAYDTRWKNMIPNNAHC